MFSSYFFGDQAESTTRYQQWIAATSTTLVQSLPHQPYAGDSPTALADVFQTDLFPVEGRSLVDIQQQLATVITKSIALWHPHTAAHLHTPVLLPALAAEVVLTALNQSMDSFDQAPAATIIEQQMLAWLCRLVDFPASAGGTFTAGGTQSNYMGLLLARDHYIERHLQWRVHEHGLPPAASRLRVLCSEMAHFSVTKAAIQLGLGTHAVVKVACDDAFRLSPHDLVCQLQRIRAEGLLPFALVATAGTTDFGSFDPIATIAAIAREEKLWFHIDAAYGGALLLSPQHRHLFTGLSQADSVTLDFHKAFFQPISCGAFLLADQQRFNLIRVMAEYLNSEDRERDGIPDLVTRSVLTTRRFDALKLWVSLQAVGQATFAAMIEHLVKLARDVAQAISTRPNFELLHVPQFGCLVFRYRPSHQQLDCRRLNEAISRRLFEQGKAVLGHTKVYGQTYLKLTLNHPCTTLSDILALLDTIVASGQSLEQEFVSHGQQDKSVV